MRIIIFKAKSVDGGEWVEGSYMKTHKFSENGMIHCIAKSDKLYHTWNECLVVVDPATVCQFTGLLDSKGVRIFESDKVNLFFTPYEGVEGATDCNWDGHLELNPWGVAFVTDAKDNEGNNAGNLLSNYYDFCEESITVTGSIHDSEATK